MNKVKVVYGLLLVSFLATSCKKDIDLKELNTKPAGANSERANAVLATKVYFISATGNDNNNGTSVATAWRTLAKVNAQTFLPGDQILFEAGKTFTGYLDVHNSGTSGNDIRFASYGSGKASINAGNGNGIYVYNNSYVVIDSLNVIGGWNASSQTGNTAYGILFYTDLANAVKLGGVSVINCNITGFKQSGIGFLSYPADLSQSGYNSIMVKSNNVYGNGQAGISTLGPSAPAGSIAYAFPYVYIANNKVYDNLGVKSNTGSHSGNGIIIGDASGGIVENNVAYNNGWYNLAPSGGPAAIWCYDSKNIIFQYNEAHHNGTGAGKPDGDGFDLDGGAVNCIMQYNYSHDNYGTGFLVWEYGNTRIKNSGNILRYNISQNDNTNNNNTVYGGMSFGPSCSNNLIYNNTIWSNYGSCIFITGGKNNQFYNNIFFGTRGNTNMITSTTSNCRFLNNNYYNPFVFRIKFTGTTYTYLTSFRTTGNEKLNNINYGYAVNPQLNAPGTGGNINTGSPFTLTNYSLNAGSPMINRGYNLTSLGFNTGTSDFKKASVPFAGGYDIGACERH